VTGARLGKVAVRIPAHNVLVLETRGWIHEGFKTPNGETDFRNRQFIMPESKLRAS
jgi:hypothetical protein